MDPLELRRRNASVTGSLMPIGTPFPSIGLTTILDHVAAHDCWRSPLGSGSLPRGRGLALGYWRGTSMTSAAHVTIAGDGRPMVTMGSVDISGTRTTMAQVAAEEFGLSIDDVHVAMGDTKSAAIRTRRPAVAWRARWRRRCRKPAGMRSGSCASARPRSCSARRRISPSRRACSAGAAGRRLDQPRRPDAGDALRRRHHRSRRVDQAAARRRDRGACRRRRGRSGDGSGDGAALHGVPGCRPRAEPRRGRRPDRGQRRARPRLGVDGRLRLRCRRPTAEREPARLPHADRARRAADRVRAARDAGAGRALPGSVDSGS